MCVCVCFSMHRKDFPAPNMHIFRLGEDGWNSPHFLQSTHRSPWKGISQILPLFQTFIKFSLGNDSTNRFGLIAGPLFSLSAFFFSIKKNNGNSLTEKVSTSRPILEEED